MPVDEKTLNEEAGLGPEWTPVDSSPIVPGMTPSAPSPNLQPLGSNFVGSIPSGMQHDASLVRTGINSSRLPNYHLMPVAPSGNPGVVSAVQSVIGKPSPAVASTGMRFRGTWLAYVNYAINDVVIFNLSAYVAIQGSTGVEPDGQPLIWTLLSENFVFGASGSSSGANGVGPFDKEGDATGNNSTLSVGPLTPANGTSLAFLWGSTFAATATFGAGFHPLDPNASAGSAPFIAIKELTSTAPFTGTATLASSTTWAGIMTLFKYTGNVTAAITSGSEDGGTHIVTLKCLNTFTTKTWVFITGLSTLTWLNNRWFQITSAISTQIQFVDNTHIGYADTPDSGTAANSPYLQALPTHSGAFTGPVTESFSVDTTKGSAIIVFAQTSGPSSALSTSFSISASDSQGNPYTVYHSNYPANFNPAVAIAIATNVPGGPLTVTYAPTNAGVFSAIYTVYEIAASPGVITYLPYDVEEFLGSMYVCLVKTTGSPTTDPTSWGLLAQGTGGVDSLSGAYLAAAADYGRLKVNTSGSSYTVTLPAIPPKSGPNLDATWWMGFQNVGSGTIVINPNGLNLDGSASNLTLTTGQGVLVFTDGSNYFTERGMSASVVGAAIWNTTAKSANYNAVAGDMVLATTTGGGFTVTIPSAAANTNKSIRVKKVSSDANVVTLSAADNIDGVATQTIGIQYNEWEIISDGSTWWAA